MTHRRPVAIRRIKLVGLAVATLFIAIAVGLTVGEVTIPPWRWAEAWHNEARLILVSIRLPRIVLAALVGAALAMSGALLQALLRNPLADPHVMGVSGAACVGAIGATLIGLPVIPTAFGGSVLHTVMTVVLAKRQRMLNSHVLLLTGVVLSFFYAAAIMFFLTIAPIYQSHTILFWLMGHLEGGDPRTTMWLGVPILGLTGLFSLAGSTVNLIALGDDHAEKLGIDLFRWNLLILVGASLLTALAVTLAGTIGFVGLLVPHLLRRLMGADHRQLLPLAAIIGGAFLIFSDAIARTLLAQELPVGVVTAFVGSPYFLWLLRRNGAIGQAAWRTSAMAPPMVRHDERPLTLRCRELSFGFPDGEPILRAISISIAAGKVTGLLGANGSGKTTLLKVLAGLRRPTAGNVDLDDQHISQLSPRAIARQIVLSAPLPLPEFGFSVREIVAMGRTPHHGLMARWSLEDQALVDDALQFCGLLSLADRPVNRLSNGEWQRVLFAQALAQQPRILLLDEATAFLDLHHQFGLLERVRQLSRETGLTVLSVTHDINLAAELCDELILLASGRIVATGRPSEALTPLTIEQAFGVKAVVSGHPPHVSVRSRSG